MPVSEHDREQAREDFEQLVTDILVALDDALGDHAPVLFDGTDVDGTDVDAAREAVMRELLADWELRHAG